MSSGRPDQQADDAIQRKQPSRRNYRECLLTPGGANVSVLCVVCVVVHTVCRRYIAGCWCPVVGVGCAYGSSSVDRWWVSSCQCWPRGQHRTPTNDLLTTNQAEIIKIKTVFSNLPRFCDSMLSVVLCSVVFLSKFWFLICCHSFLDWPSASLRRPDPSSWVIWNGSGVV